MNNIPPYRVEDSIYKEQRALIGEALSKCAPTGEECDVCPFDTLRELCHLFNDEGPEVTRVNHHANVFWSKAFRLVAELKAEAIHKLEQRSNL